MGRGDFMSRLVKPSLFGKFVKLRPLSVADAQAMYASMDDEEAMKLTGTQSNYSFEDVEKHLKYCQAATDRLDFAVLRESEIVGEVVLNNIDFINKSASFRIAIWTGKNRNRGFGTEATSLVVHYGFETLKLNRIELEVYSFNDRAKYIYSKAGFIYEGTRRQALNWQGEWVDAHIMAILNSDFFNKDI
jgi:RimJ/RimL family protein N-acetyltransferase